MSRLPRNRILLGDTLAKSRNLPNGSVDCIISSPPYWNLRNYDADGQFGLERDIHEWVDNLRAAAREWARLLVPTGTLWLNLGDTYSTHVRQGAPRKGLLLGPERVALALTEDGWILRNKITWSKTSTTPSSVTDRLSTKHEYIYVFARSPRYFFDLHAIREPHSSASRTKPQPMRNRGKTPTRPAWLGPNGDSDMGLVAMHRAGIPGHPLGKNPGDVWRLGVSSFRGAHFATFPEQLAERMLRAGCPERRCTRCRAPWTRPLKREGTHAELLSLRPTCTCDTRSEPGLVLDPFIGSGTTAVVAERLGRDWLGIELNPTFAELAKNRVSAARLLTNTRKEVP